MAIARGAWAAAHRGAAYGWRSDFAICTTSRRAHRSQLGSTPKCVHRRLSRGWCDRDRMQCWFDVWSMRGCAGDFAFIYGDSAGYEEPSGLGDGASPSPCAIGELAGWMDWHSRSLLTFAASPSRRYKHYSLYFNGGSYTNLGNSSLGLTANSISIWFKTTSTTSGQQLLSKYGSTPQFQFRLETNGTITLYSFESGGTFATLQSTAPNSKVQLNIVKNKSHAYS